MKTIRLLFFAVTLLSTVLLLAACFNPGTTPATTTAPVTTAPTTTAEVTTAPTTTATTTTAPTPVSQNPIKEVRTMPNGNVRLTYEDGKTQFLGTAELREGYNSVSFTYAFDADTGILTLTLIDSTARNVAADLLSIPKTTKIVRLREAGGNLEWADALADNWQVLCPYKLSARDEAVLTQLCRAVGIGKHEESLGSGVVLVIEGDKFRIRARGWKDGIDFVHDGHLHGNSNGNFNFDLLGEISASAPTGSISAGTDVSYKTFKNAKDDVAPIQMNGTYIAAGHGYNIVSVVPNSIGLTLKDIGRVFVRQSDGQKYMLIKIPGFDTGTQSGGSLWFCPFDTSSMANGNFGKYTYVTLPKNTTGLKGGNTIFAEDDTTETYTIAANATEGQIHSSINHLVQYGYLNGTNEIDLTTNGVYEAEFIDIYEEYDVLYLPAVLNYLGSNVGKNDNDSLNSDEITDYYFSHRNTFRFHKNGSCVVYSTYDFKKSITLSYIGGSQSIPFATRYVYMPGTKDYGVPTLHPSSTQIEIAKTDLVNPDVLTSSYFQLTDTKGTQAMNLGYNPFYGTAVNDIRDSYLGTTKNPSYAGKTLLVSYFTSYKMYPKLISHCDLKPGDFVSCISYRVPSYILDEDFFAINWYWVGDDIYLSLHTDKAVDKTVTCLPDYMNGMGVEIYENSGFQVNTSIIENGSLEVATDGAGYVFIKLSPID